MLRRQGLTDGQIAPCERGLRVVSVTQQLRFNGAVGKMLAAVLLGIAEMEQETRRERQTIGIAAVSADPKLRPGSTVAPRNATCTQYDLGSFRWSGNLSD